MALLTEVNFIKPLSFRTVNLIIYFQSRILATTLRPEQVKPNFKKTGETARSMRKKRPLEQIAFCFFVA